MKKIILFISLLVSLTISGVAYAYTIQPGDNLSKISQKFSMVWQELWGLNPQIENPNLIYPGQEISVEPQLGATSPVAGATYSLAGSGITSSATSITLQSLTTPQTGRELLDADFSETFYITLEPGNSKRQEIVSCTTVAQNANDTATLSGCIRGLLPFTPFTASTTYAFSHAGGTMVIFSDPPQLFNEYAAKGNAETITSVWNYDVYPAVSSSIGNATTSRQLITLGQANSIGNQGAATSTESNAGICELATQIEMASSTNLGANTPLCLQARYATSTPTNAFLYIPITQNNGKLHQGFFDLTELFIFSATTITSSTLTSSTHQNFMVKNSNGNKLYDGSYVSTTLESSYHSHASLMKTGVGSRNAGTGTFTVTHGLGFVPQLVELEAYSAHGGSDTNGIYQSHGSATSTESQMSLWRTWADNSGVAIQNVSTTAIMVMQQSNSPANNQTAWELTSLTAQTFTINVKVDAHATTTQYLWKVYR